LDTGTCDGLVATPVRELRPDLSLDGIDVLVRPRRHIEVRPFDGKNIPYEDASFEAVMLVDVVHHADRPFELLTEATRVASRCLVVKDLMLEGRFAERTRALRGKRPPRPRARSAAPASRHSARRVLSGQCASSASGRLGRGGTRRRRALTRVLGRQATRRETTL
jgi:hypothetical protein